MNKHGIKNNNVYKVLLKIKKTILIFLFDRWNKDQLLIYNFKMVS